MSYATVVNVGVPFQGIGLSFFRPSPVVGRYMTVQKISLDEVWDVREMGFTAP